MSDLKERLEQAKEKILSDDAFNVLNPLIDEALAEIDRLWKCVDKITDQHAEAFQELTDLILIDKKKDAEIAKLQHNLSQCEKNSLELAKQKDARIAELEKEITGLGEQLRDSQHTINKLCNDDKLNLRRIAELEEENKEFLDSCNWLTIKKEKLEKFMGSIRYNIVHGKPDERGVDYDWILNQCNQALGEDGG